MLPTTHPFIWPEIDNFTSTKPMKHYDYLTRKFLFYESRLLV
jgi:hypothetical protein